MQTHTHIHTPATRSACTRAQGCTDSAFATAAKQLMAYMWGVAGEGGTAVGGGVEPSLCVMCECVRVV